MEARVARLAALTWPALALALLALLALAEPTAARAQGAAAPLPEDAFQSGAAALARGEHAAAIDVFEALADRGFVHPDASYNRGLAYALRARARADRPGDLGRAAAAFEEARRLRPGDVEAERALDAVRAEITRRRSRRARDEVDVRPTLDRVIVGLASEQAWGYAALAASILFAAGLFLRRRPAGPAHVAGSVLAPAALVAVLALTPLAAFARHLRLTTQPGVIVAPEAYFSDDTGRALGRDPIPEGASVEVGRRAGGLVEVRWGATVGWVPASSVRLLAR